MVRRLVGRFVTANLQPGHARLHRRRREQIIEAGRRISLLRQVRGKCVVRRHLGEKIVQTAVLQHINDGAVGIVVHITGEQEPLIHERLIAEGRLGEDIDHLACLHTALLFRALAADFRFQMPGEIQKARSRRPASPES